MIAGKTLTSLLLFFSLLLTELAAQEAVYPDFSQLQGLFWVDRGYQVSDDAFPADQRLIERSTEEYIGELLELCRLWFSGMIYGYDFYYQPSDRTRQVEEIFTLDPVYQIPWGDSGLEYLDSIEENEQIEMAFRYLTREHEVSRLRGWRASNFPNTAGQAETPDRGDLQSRVASFQEAVKQAIRNHFRELIFNKPKEIRGRIALFAMPRSFAAAGLVHTSVKITIDTDTIVAYRQF